MPLYAVILDAEKYLQSYSDKYRTPESILVGTIPNESDPEKMRCYQYIKKKWVFDAEKWSAIEAQREETARKQNIEAEIEGLKKTLESSDYKVIKCCECVLNELQPPYDVGQIHEERQKIRDRINELESAL